MITNQIELFVHPPATEASNVWLQVALKFLDWPFLVFVALTLFIWIFKKQLKALLNRENIEIKWGDKSILLRDLGQKIEQDIDSKFDSIQDESKAETPNKTVSDSLTKKFQGAQFLNDASLQKTDELNADVLSRIKEALMSPTFRWRTLSRLAAIGGVSESEARLLVASLGVDFDVNKSGQTIVKLKSR